MAAPYNADVDAAIERAYASLTSCFRLLDYEVRFPKTQARALIRTADTRIQELAPAFFICLVGTGRLLAAAHVEAHLRRHAQALVRRVGALVRPRLTPS